MQQLRILSTFSITQDTENAIEKLQKAEKELSRKGGGNLAPRDRVMDKNCVKASYSTTSGFHDMNESKWCDAYADDTIPCIVWIFLILLLRNQLFFRFSGFPEEGELLPNVGGHTMNQVRLVADSSCDLLTLSGMDFVSVPLTIRTETEEFRDDAALDVDGMVRALRDTNGRSYSACPNVADWEEAFGGRGDVIAFTITSGLSGSYGVACAAKESCEERDPSRRIQVFDSLSAGPEIALLIEKAAAELRVGTNFDTVCNVLKSYQSQTHLLFALESMHNLAQNGRVSKLAATVAGVLGIRVVGQASAEGTLEMLGKCRGARRTLEFLLRTMERLGYRGGRVRIGHCQNEVLAQDLCSELLHLFPQADIKSYPLRGLCSYYAERGGIMLGFEA